MTTRTGILAMVERHIDECERKIYELQEELKHYQKTEIRRQSRDVDSSDNKKTGE